MQQEVVHRLFQRAELRVRPYALEASQPQQAGQGGRRGQHNQQRQQGLPAAQHAGCRRLLPRQAGVGACQVGLHAGGLALCRHVSACRRGVPTPRMQGGRPGLCRPGLPHSTQSHVRAPAAQPTLMLSMVTPSNQLSRAACSTLLGAPTAAAGCCEAAEARGGPAGGSGCCSCRASCACQAGAQSGRSRACSSRCRHVSLAGQAGGAAAGAGAAAAAAAADSSSAAVACQPQPALWAAAWRASVATCVGGSSAGRSSLRPRLGAHPAPSSDQPSLSEPAELAAA